MSTLVLGAGFIILAIVWTLCILLCIVFSRLEGSVAYLGTLCILIAIIVTIVLWFYPRATVVEEKHVIYDNIAMLRTALISVLGIMLFVGTVVVAAVHVFEQRRASSVKPWTY